MPNVELIEVAPSVLCVRRPRYLSASYIVHDDKGIVLVDAGMEADGSDMIEGLRAVGAKPPLISAILLTHWHNDHSSGAEALRLISGAKVYYHSSESRNYSQTAVSDLRRSLSNALPEHGPLSAVKALVGQSPPRKILSAITISGNELLLERFQAFHTPGHTAGHVSYLYQPETVLFAGDAIAVCFNRLWFLSRFLTEDIALARSSMHAVASIDSSAICPGHRGPLTASVKDHRRQILEHLESGNAWPLFS